MNWKDNIQVRDLRPEETLALRCRYCGKVRRVTGAELAARNGAMFLYLSEVEARARCRQRGCNGAMLLSWPATGETAGFVGGIA